MIAWIAVAAGSATVAGLFGLAISRRTAHYHRLTRSLARTLSAECDQFDPPRHSPPGFSRHIATVPDFLPDEQLSSLRHEVERLASVERSYIPTHKKGGAVAYENLIERAPAVTRHYHSEALRRFISQTFGVEIHPTPLHDQSSLSILIYERPGDHIDWHYDHNFYRGRHFTVLLPLINTGTDDGGLSHARLSVNLGGQIVDIPTPANTLVMFEGTEVLHKASPILAGERRVLISMTFCTDPRATFTQAVTRRLKDTAFFGLRALWTGPGQLVRRMLPLRPSTCTALGGPRNGRSWPSLRCGAQRATRC